MILVGLKVKYFYLLWPRQKTYFRTMIRSGVTLTLSLWLLLVLALTACEYETAEPLHQYPEAVGEILTTTCAISNCHLGSEAPEGLDLSTWSKAFEGSEFGSVIIPFNHEWSHLFQHINTYEALGIRATPVMPPNGPALSREEVSLIRDWINEGAPDKNGNFRWQEEKRSGVNKVFALCAGSDLVAVSDLSSNLVMEFIPVGQIDNVTEAPHYIRLSPDGKYFYLTLIGGGYLEKYSTENYELQARLEVGPDPALIELSEDGERLIISHWNSSSNTPKLTMVDAVNMQIIQQVVGGAELLSFGHGMASTGDYRTLYIVANEGNYYSKYEMDISGFVSEEKIPIDPQISPVPQATTFYKPYHCFLSPDESLFFVSCSEQDELRVFQTSNDSLIATIPTGDYPRLMDFDPLDNRLYVACRDEENFAEQGSMLGCVSVIDVNSLSLLENIYRLGHRPHGVGVATKARRLYISSENTGGIDPPHHPIEGASGSPGKYNIVDLNTLSLLSEEETEIAVFPNALIVSEN